MTANPIALELLQAESDRLETDHYARADLNCDGCTRLAAVSAEFAALSETPQVYVYLTSGGILDYRVTRGDVDVIDVDWDELMERSIEDWEGVIATLEGIADIDLRDAEIAEAAREIEKIRDYDEAEAAAEVARAKGAVEAARKILQAAGELP